MNYVVVHADSNVQLMSGRLVVPAREVEAFHGAAECAQAMAALSGRQEAAFADAMKKAREEGFTKGFEEGREQAAVKFAAVAAEMAKQARDHYGEACAAVATLSLGVVRKLATRLGAEAMVPELVEQAVASIAPEPINAVRVNPLVADLTRERLKEIGASDIAVVADSSLDAFGCVMETLQGSHLAGLDDQLQTIGRVLGVAHEPAHAVGVEG